MTRVAVFGSGDSKPGSRCYREAERAGYLLAKAGFSVLNGGYGGSMEASARGAKRARGRTVGVTARAFGARANRFIDKEIQVDTWPQRVLKLMEMAGACVVLEGGTGTLVELAVRVETAHKGLLPKCPIVSVGAFWKRVLAALGKGPCMQLEGVVSVNTPDQAVKFLLGCPALTRRGPARR